MLPKSSRYYIPRRHEREERNVGGFCVPLARVPRAKPHHRPEDPFCPYEFVYAIAAGDTGMVKFGFTRRLEKRRQALQNGNPYELRYVGFAEVETGKARLVERVCFELAAPVHVRNEWYKMDPYAAGLTLRCAIRRVDVPMRRLYGVVKQ